MIVVENDKTIGKLEGFSEEFTQLLKKYDFEYRNVSKMLSEIRRNKTFQLREEYNKFNLDTSKVRELEIDTYRDSIETIEERYRKFFSDKTIEDKIKQIVNSRHLNNSKTINNVEEIRKLTGKEQNMLHVHSYSGFLKFRLYDVYSIRKLVSELRELFSYLDYPIYKQEDIDFKQIERYEPHNISDNLTLVLYKNHNIKISYVKKPKANEETILREVYEIYKRFNTSSYFEYL